MVGWGGRGVDLAEGRIRLKMKDRQGANDHSVVDGRFPGTLAIMD